MIELLVVILIFNKMTPNPELICENIYIQSDLKSRNYYQKSKSFRQYLKIV